MILADTSVWIDHFRQGNKDFALHLENNRICIHPFIIGEIACGNLVRRATVLQYFKTLYSIDGVSHEEVLAFIDMYKLNGQGLGYVDIHLLAAAKLTSSLLWTLDKRLKNAAEKLSVHFKA